MRTKRFVIISIPLVAACKSPKPAEQMDSIQSWLGTATMVGDAWLRHGTPDKYSRHTLELSHENLLKISVDLIKAPPQSVDSATLDQVLTRSRDRVGQMARLIEAKNAPAFARQLDSLSADQKVMKQLADRTRLTQ
ncbi:MAG: hypothetical protein ABI408_10985 [Gemmatimonadaceae bacterium]